MAAQTNTKTKANTGTKSNSKKPKNGLIIGLITVIILAGVGFLGWMYYDAQQEVDRLKNPQEAAKLEVEVLVERVSSLTELPNEMPTVATVQDKTKLQSQAFFAKAENGDKVLIFTQSKRAILFRPSTNKIIEIAPINIGENQQSPAQ